MFRKAERRQAKLRLALCGPSGSGKTYSALLIAQGLAPGAKVALIDTERGSGELYAGLMDYDVAPLDPPFTPIRYVELIREAEQAGYDVLIIDGLSHAWVGEGGVLDMHDKATAASRSGNSFAAWREVTPAHNQLVDTLLGADLHIITTMRTKTAYDMVDDGRGKKKPVKIGLAPVQRDGMEYEFTLVMDLSVEGHVATASKDRTSLFDGSHFVPTAETGEGLREWLEFGKDPVEESRKLLRRLKAQVSRIEAVPQLNNWWRQHGADIDQLTTADAKKLKACCTRHKSALLAEDGEEHKGNGKDAAGLDAVVGEIAH
ncbi:MAG: AAA family ATPase [Gammaproteobacteria bacterium]|nr:AAA family ATPase [Gammaproteobacteria bacterium]